MLNKLNICMPYYDNKDMLGIHLEHWKEYGEYLDKVNFIIVDDGSPTFPAKDILKGTNLPIRLFRIHEDIPWNMHGARNLGMKHAGKDWTFLTDMDLVVTKENLIKLFELEVNPRKFYMFGRVKMPEKEPYKRHPNTFLLTPGAFWKVNGYNTFFCGSYGGDGLFKRDLEKVVTEEQLDHIQVEYYPRGYIKDSGTNNYERQGFYKEEYRRRLGVRGLYTNWDPTPFAWHEETL